MNQPETFAGLLTKRELEILALLVENKTNQEIADQLHLALSSVKWYAGEIYGKLGVENRRQAVRMAVDSGLLGKPGQAAQEAPRLPSGIVTFLFTDIEGSTPLWEKMPEAMQVAVARHHDLLRKSIEANGGLAFQIIGDAFQAAFRLASDGLCAALAAQRALRDAHWGPTGPLKVRMGLHTGPAELDSHGDAPYQVGHTLNRAARVMSAGFGGQILLSQETADLVERELPEGVTLEDLGQHHLKGLQRSEHLYQVAADDLPRDFPPLLTAIQNPNNLPQEFTSFIGREEEIHLLSEQIRAGKTRLLTLTGAGGTGKTRLSLKVAAQVIDAFPAGVWLVELAPLAEPELVVPTVAQVFGLREVPGTPLIQTLCAYLKNKRALLILDNCEHLLSACAELAGKLLQSGPDVRLLASSREILNVPGEAPFRVPSLPVPPLDPLAALEELERFEAVRLFVERAAQVSNGFTLTGSNARSVITICRRLDGIPLALELAASRVRVMPVEQIAARLDNVFRLLMGGARTVMPRQQTLKAAIDWSYNLLNAKEKMALQRLSVFSGGWTLEAAEQILPDSPGKVDCEQEEISSDEMLDLLASLVDKSLVTLSGHDSDPLGAATEPRYRMLETIRQYARDRLLEAGCGEAVRDRHLAYYLAFSEEAERHFRTKDQISWLDLVEVELDNIRLALEWSLDGRLVEEGMLLVSALKWFWHIHSRYVEGSAWMERLLTLEAEERGAVPLAVGRQSSSYLLAWVRCVNALSLDLIHHPVKTTQEQMIDLLEQAAILCEEIGPSANRDLFWSMLSRADLIPNGEPLKEEALQVARENHFRFEEAQALFYQWKFVITQSLEFERGARVLQESLAIAQELQDVDGIGERMFSMAILMAISGDQARAHAIFHEATQSHQKVKNDRSIHYWEITFLRFTQDQQAIEKAEQALRYFEERQDVQNQLYGYNYLIQAEWSNGNTARAEQLMDDALPLAARTPSSFIEFMMLSIYAAGLAIANQNIAKAAPHLQTAGTILARDQPDNLEAQYNFLAVLSTYALGAGEAAQSARISGAIDAVYQVYKNLQVPWQTRIHVEAQQASRLALGEEAFRSAFAEGQAIPFPQAVSTFLEEFLQSSKEQASSG